MVDGAFAHHYEQTLAANSKGRSLGSFQKNQTTGFSCGQFSHFG